ncbi:MAG: UDP-N-acetylglucosamine 2-epimerase (non-hydrolyzing) [Lacunisphaera sp.]
MPKLIDLIAGARPNFMKIAPIIDALRVAQGRGSILRFRLIHTGQHYDRNMSGRFFEELGIPEPDVNLQVGSGSSAEQTAAIMIRYEKVLIEQKSDLCLVVGDVTSTMACAIVAQKLAVPVAHVEGGIRSGDWRMPEEINRMVTDAITNWFFTTSETANQILRNNGVEENRIYFVGNTMIDTVHKQLPRFRKPTIWKDAKLQAQEYFVLTLHRPANVDEPLKLRAMLKAVIDGSQGKVVLFPVHPRTAKILEQLEFHSPLLRVIEPLGYREFNYLVQNAFAVITDSGGVTEEATVLGVPCLTMRDNTERPETVTLGTNELVGTNPENLAPYFKRLFSGHWKKGSIPPLWDGKTGQRIVAHLEALLS